jgi:hypothetical protein
LNNSKVQEGGGGGREGGLRDSGWEGGRSGGKDSGRGREGGIVEGHKGVWSRVWSRNDRYSQDVSDDSNRPDVTRQVILLWPKHLRGCK